MKKYLLLLLLIVLVVLQKASAQTPGLVKDINAITPNSDAVPYIEFNNELYFLPISSNLLYKTDGSTGGTVMVKSISPAASASFISNNSLDFKVANGNLFFCAHGTNSVSLWKTDGTEAGTVMVKQVSGVAQRFNGFEFTTFGGLIFFKRDNIALWRSDGTDAGTFELLPNYSRIFLFNGNLYVVGTTAATGTELFKTDGTVAGTVLVKDINPGTGGSAPVLFGTAGTIGTDMFFSATDGVNGVELWKTDGTEAGTVLVKDINPGAASSLATLNSGTIGNEIFFRANDGVNGVELWKTDGTTAGTVLVKDINPGAGNSDHSFMTLFNNELYFSATDITNGAELWKTNGTTAGTVLVKDINSGAGSSVPNSFFSHNGLLVFTASTVAEGNELWKTDGTTVGTELVFDINAGSASSTPAFRFTIGNDIYYRLTDAAGVNIWRTDGTAANTVKINVPGVPNPNPTITQILGLNNRILFTSAVAAGNELYYSNATNTEAAFVKDINPGASNGIPTSLGGFPNRIMVINGKAVFTAQSPGIGTEPWVTDGTEAGTFLLKDVAGNSNASNPAAPLAVGSTIYFSASDGIAGNELWKTDGTSGGTVLVKDIQPGTSGQGVLNLCSNNDLLFFNGATTSSNRELWVSDGTSAGTIEIPINPNTSASSNPAFLTSYDNSVYFFAANGTNGTELYKSDGTVAGTSMVKDASTLPGSVIANGVVQFDGKMVYDFNDGANGSEIWVSDGTAAGTLLNQNINASASGSNPSNFMVVGNELFFSASNGSLGNELWKMTSTVPNSAQLVKDITVGVSGSNLSGFTNVNGTLYFVRALNQLWKSNGTDATTVQLLTAPATIAQIISVDGEVFMICGTTLYRLDAGGATVTSVKNGTVLPQTLTTVTSPYVVGNSFYFSASSTIPGTMTAIATQLWKCNKDELVATLLPVSSVAPLPANFIYNNQVLYFAATDLEHNRELFRLLISGTVPLNLISFTGAKQNNNALLQWKTANEVNVSRFELQRSDDGQSFAAISTVTAGGNNYSYTDAGVFNNRQTVFYRLKSIDVDSRFTLSAVVRLRKESESMITIFPNPATDRITITGLQPGGNITVVDMDGRRMQQQYVTAQTITTDVSMLAAGTYIIRYEKEGMVLNKKIVVQK